VYSRIVTVLLWISAIGAGLIAGVFFAFSTFVMTALDRAGQVCGILVMNSINSTILQSMFMPVFYGTTLTSAALAVVALSSWDGNRSAVMLAAAVLYVLGMFMCTVVFNVPLNDALDAVDPVRPASAAMWTRFLNDWTFWNHVRTVAALGAASLFTFVLCARTG
jgi:uncharacterized membrane protein